MIDDLTKVLDLLREAVDQIAWNAAADALQSFPVRDRELEAADKLLAKIADLRGKLSTETAPQNQEASK